MAFKYDLVDAESGLTMNDVVERVFSLVLQRCNKSGKSYASITSYCYASEKSFREGCTPINADKPNRHEVQQSEVEGEADYFEKYFAEDVLQQNGVCGFSQSQKYLIEQCSDYYHNATPI